MNSSVPKKIILIGASTGGPGEIQKIVEALPKLHNTSVLIGQHMVDGFLDSFTQRLQNTGTNTTSIARDKEALVSGHIYVCEGHTQVVQNSSSVYFSKSTAHAHSYNPDINILFNSFNTLTKEVKILCVILTGIGDDGVDACQNLSAKGARCITQSKESAIVDGMPSRVRLLVPKVEVCSTAEIIRKIKDFTQNV